MANKSADILLPFVLVAAVHDLGFFLVRLHGLDHKMHSKNVIEYQTCNNNLFTLTHVQSTSCTQISNISHTLL